MDLQPVTEAIFTALRSDTTVTNLTAAHAILGGAGVYPERPVPPSAERPYIVIGPELDGGDRNTKTGLGTAVSRDVFVFTDSDDPYTTATTLTDAIRALFGPDFSAGYKRAPQLDLPSGWVVLEHTVAGPVEAETDPSIRGRAVTVTLVVQAPEAV